MQMKKTKQRNKSRSEKQTDEHYANKKNRKRNKSRSEKRSEENNRNQTKTQINKEKRETLQINLSLSISSIHWLIGV